MLSPFKEWQPHLPLAREKFFVFRHGTHWKIRHDEQIYGPYFVSREAIRDAIERAYCAGCEGTGAQVFVEVKTDEFKLEWTYGLDPNPAHM